MSLEANQKAIQGYFGLSVLDHHQRAFTSGRPLAMATHSASLPSVSVEVGMMPGAEPVTLPGSALPCPSVKMGETVALPHLQGDSVGKRSAEIEGSKPEISKKSRNVKRGEWEVGDAWGNYPQREVIHSVKIQFLFKFRFRAEIAFMNQVATRQRPTKGTAFSYQMDGLSPTKWTAFSYQTDGSVRGCQGV
jgi:hypothetical protein